MSDKHNFLGLRPTARVDIIKDPNLRTWGILPLLQRGSGSTPRRRPASESRRSSIWKPVDPHLPLGCNDGQFWENTVVNPSLQEVQLPVCCLSTSPPLLATVLSCTNPPLPVSPIVTRLPGLKCVVSFQDLHNLTFPTSQEVILVQFHFGFSR